MPNNLTMIITSKVVKRTHPMRLFLSILVTGAFLGSAAGRPAGASNPESPYREVHLPGPARQGLSKGEAILATDPPPLPGDCSELAEPSADPPTLCVYGYVYLDGTPMSGAAVSLELDGVSIEVTTGSGPGSTEPYYGAALSESPLSVSEGDLVRVEANTAGETNSTTFKAASSAQQVDVYLSTSCGPTTIPGGVINIPTNWMWECSPYVVTGNLVIQAGVTLTIEPGTVVQFEDDRALLVSGALSADAAAEAMIVFTSSIGPVPGTWGYIVVGASGEATLSYALIEYAGGASITNNGALRVDGSSPTIENIVVRHSASNGIAIFNYGEASISDSLISDNTGSGIYSSSAAGANIWYNTINDNDDGGIFVNNGGEFWILNNTIAGNTNGSGIDIRNNATSGVIANNFIAGNVNPGSSGGGIYNYMADVDIIDNVITGNQARWGGGIRAASISSARDIYINGNIITGNEATTSGGGIHYSNSAVTYLNFNVLAENRADSFGGGLYLDNINATNSVANNTIIRNQSGDNGSGIWVDINNANLFYNTVIDNVTGEGLGGIYVKNHPIGFHHNNIYGNSDYDVFNGNTEEQLDVIAENNWWFAFTTETIRSHIWDWYDDPNLGFIDFEPFRTDFVLEAPISPPDGLSTSVAVSGTDSTITVSWEANAEDDLAGYQVYYDIDADYIYSGTGALEGNSPIDVGNVLSATLTDLPPGTYYLTVTAYDSSADGDQDQTDGHESWFAETVTALIAEEPLANFSAAPTSGVAPLTVTFTDKSTGTIDSWNWAFGDGGSSAAQHPQHTYNSAGVYTVTLQVSGPAGSNSFSRVNYIQVHTPVDAAFSASPTSGPAPLVVTFSNTSSGDYDTCSWGFGDGTTSSQCTNPSHTYNLEGSYPVSLTVSGSGGTDTMIRSNYIVVGSAVSADFSATPTSGIAPLIVQFNNQSSGDYTTCLWTFGDNKTSSQCNNPAHSYNAAGVYSVSLTVSGLGGSDTLTRSNYITVYTPVDAAFSATQTTGPAPLTVNFNNQSSGDFDTCSWDFGDGQTGDQCVNPGHTYNYAGTFNVSLTVSGPGGSDTLTRSAYISVYNPVSANFSASPTSGPAPLTVNFSNSSSGDYSTCAWNFGDGDTNSQCGSPAHIFNATGTYTVSLTVSGLGGSDTLNRADYITVYDPVEAGFSATPTSGPTPLTVNFTNTSSGDYADCLWNFGDNQTSSQCVDPAHTYTADGLYTVSLTVSGLGGSDTLTRAGYITVYAPVKAGFTATPTSGPAPLTVTFTNTSSGDYVTCLWDFGENQTSSQCADPTHTYTADGIYTVSLTVSGPGGTDILTRADYINVGSTVFAEFSATPLAGTVSLSVTFTNLSGGDYDTCRWDFGDGYTSKDCADPAHQYTLPGSYHVSLMVSGAGGKDVEIRKDYIVANPAEESWFGHGPDGGNIYGLARAPSNPDIVYAASNHGVFKSTDAGQSWARTRHPYATVYAVQVAPDDPNAVYGGTADGIYKSEDGGEVWLHLGLDGARVNTIVIDPTNANILFAGTGYPWGGSVGDVKAIFKSLDGGQSWQQKLAVSDAVMASLIAPDDSDTIYAGVLNSGDGFLKSDDGGDSWTSIHIAADEENDEEVYALAMTPAGSDPAVLYAYDCLTLEEGVYKSHDGGENWSRVLSTEMWDFAAFALAVDPINTDVVYAASANLGGEFWRSVDGGATWQRKEGGLAAGGTSAILVDPRNGHVLAGQYEGGVYRSGNNAENWAFSSQGLDHAGIAGVAVHPADAMTVLAVTAGGGFHLSHTADGGLDWSSMMGSPQNLGAVVYDPQDGDTVYLGSGWGYSWDQTLYKSTNGGQNWSAHTVFEIEYEPSGISDIWVSPVNPQLILVAVEGWSSDGGGIYRSNTGGLSWSRQVSFWINSLAADPNDPTIIYAGSERCGYVFRSADSGGNWTNISPGTPPGECWVWDVRDIAVDDDSLVYAATSAGLWKWDSQSWTRLEDLPTTNMTALAVDTSTTPDTIYLGTGDEGVFESQDSGQSWSAINEGLGHLSIGKLVLSQGATRLLYAGTSGHGVWCREVGTAEVWPKTYLPVIVRQ